jgi:hypothetical protein
MEMSNPAIRTTNTARAHNKATSNLGAHPHHHDMGVGRIGRTRARLNSVESGADADRRVETPERANPRTAKVTRNVVALIVVAITAVVYVVGWMRTSWFGP